MGKYLFSLFRLPGAGTIDISFGVGTGGEAATTDGGATAQRLLREVTGGLLADSGIHQKIPWHPGFPQCALYGVTGTGLHAGGTAAAAGLGDGLGNVQRRVGEGHRQPNRGAIVGCDQQGAFSNPTQTGPGGCRFVGEGAGHAFVIPGGVGAGQGQSAIPFLSEQFGCRIAHLIQPGIVAVVGVHVSRGRTDGNVINDVQRQSNGGNHCGAIAVGGKAGHISYPDPSGFFMD